MPRFWNARLELVTQRKRKEEQAKREIEKQNRLKKKKGTKLSSTSGEELEDGHDGKSELAKQQENIVTKRQNYARRSSSSESEVPTSPGLALSHEMRKNDLFKSQERLDVKRSPPPVLPKPKTKPKPKLPPKNKNVAPAPSVQPVNSHALQEIANEISQISNKKNKLVKGSSSDSDSVDGNVFIKNEVKPRPKIAKKPVQQTKSLDFNELMDNSRTPAAVPKLAVQPSKSAEKTTQSVNDDRKTALQRQNAIYFEQPSRGYSKMENAVAEPSESAREETNSTPKEILLNLKERGANLMMNKKRVLSNMCWPLGCQNGDESKEDEDPLYSSVNFAKLGYTKENNDISEDQYRDTSQVNVPQSTNLAYSNAVYMPPSSLNPPKTDLANVVQISPDLGIKEVQSIVKGGSSYTVGDNMDLYSLPVKPRALSNNDDTDVASGKRSPEINIPDSTVTSSEDKYSLPVENSPGKMGNGNQDSDKCDIAGGSEGPYEGPYAETALFQQTPSSPDSPYDIPGLIIDTAPVPKFDLSPPNFKPPPPPAGGSPLLRKKNMNKLSPPVLRKKNKVKSPKKMLLKDVAETNKIGGLKRSQSESDLTAEPIFASPSSLGIKYEDNNNNRHSMFVTPKEFEMLREYPIYCEGGYEHDVQSGNGRTHIGNHRDGFPSIVPPPPSSTPIIDTDSMVAPPPPQNSQKTSELVPPPPMYPPPRLHPSERASMNLNEDSQWEEMVESLPPPPPELLES